MKQLNLPIKLVSFFIAIIVCVTDGMELPLQGPINNIKSIYAQSSVCDLKMYNLLNDLTCLPIKYAIASMLSVENDWIVRHENRTPFIELIRSNSLDDDVACAVIEKLNDLALARQRAQQSQITPGVALIIVNNFLKTDITTALCYFDDLFLKAFSEKILGHGNYDVLYKALMDVMTKDTSFMVATTKNDLFSMRDFNISTSSIEDSKPSSLMGGVSTDSKKKFLILSQNSHFIKIFNCEAGIELGIVVPFTIEKLLVKNDHVASRGILDTRGKIHQFTMPLALLGGEVPLQQLAALVYCKAHVYKKTRETKECMGHTIFESQDYGEEKTLIAFIQKNLQNEWVPSCLSDTLKRDSEKLHDLIILRNAFDYMACTLGITRQQVAVELYIHNVDEVWSLLHEKYHDWATNFLVETLGGPFKQWYGLK